jgi:uncharacterized protein
VKAETADDIIARLGLKPHPEGGNYIETFRAAPGPNGRAAATAIYFLLQAGERSHWHKVDVAEIWLWHAGAPLTLEIAENENTVREILLGADLGAGQLPQAVVPAYAWQAAATRGDWTLVSCVVAPGFEFSGFTLAPQDWRPST